MLATFGTRLKAALTASEEAGRYGGEEFLVVLPGAPDPVRRRVAAIRSAASEAPYEFGGACRTVTLSGGLAFLECGDTAFTLLARADAALYRAKENGRHRVEEASAAPTARHDLRRDGPQPGLMPHELG